jgi:hypothetical protein
VLAAAANTRGFVSVVGDVDHERVAVLKAALDAVGSSASGPRARLLAQLSWETHYIDDVDTLALIEEALVLTEGGPDDVARAAALFALHLYFVPSTLERRLATIAEYEQLTAGADPLRRARMAMAVAPALWQSGDIEGVRRQQGRLLAAADELGDPSVRWVHSWYGQLGALVAGDLDRAEQLVDTALQVGVAAGQPDAMLFYGAQLTALRSQQGRVHEIVDVLSAASNAAPGIPVLRAGLALLLAQVDQQDEARAILDRYVSSGLDHEIPESPLRMSALGTLGGAVGMVDHVDLALELIPCFEPYRDQIAFAGVAINGPIALMIASCARVIGDFTTAEAAFRQATEVVRRIDSPYWTAMTTLLWAQMRVERRAGDDLEVARASLAEVNAVAGRYGFAQLDQRAEELLALIS